jgi:hypothetical protein
VVATRARRLRWPWLVLSVVWVLVVVGIGVPAIWLVRGTLAASEGAKTPTVAVIDGSVV